MCQFSYLFLVLAFFSSLGFAKSAEHYPENGNPAASANIVGVYEGKFKKWFPLALQLGIDPSFSEEQSKLVKEATRIFVERALSKRVVDCAFNNASKDRPESREDIETKLHSALAPMNISGVFVPSFAFIARYWDDARSVGIGYVGLYFDTDEPMASFSNRHYLHIALNSDHLGTGKSYRFANDLDYWAGVLGHEFLHNLGFQHPSGYSGSFIQEYGHCVQNNGAEEQIISGSEIFDKEVHKDL